jgi:GNAT superfamily N-acetyltransferase
VGAIRLAMRVRTPFTEGLITDLQIDDALVDSGMPEALIAEAEARLRARGARKVDGLLLDGVGMAQYYYRLGYWSSRRSVVLAWDLAQLRDIPASTDYEVVQVDRPDADVIGHFILNSYQPYFRWWKEPREAQKWFRVELQPEDYEDQYERAGEEIRARVLEDVRNAGMVGPQTYFLAYRDGELVGLCDARDSGAGTDQFEWCVLMSRSSIGKGLGSTLLGHALRWLRDERGLTHAEYTATSGLDDYDPLIYLSTVATGAYIKGEFLHCVKTQFE